jgi:uncharacterized protein (DUF1697 family)
MSRYIAFLRAINVGGHTVKMEALRQHFESFGFSDVETFIASGNVIFQTAEQDVNILESKIASGLKTALGYDIATFVRTGEELVEIAEYQAFSLAELDEATAYNIAFLASPIDDLAKQKLMAVPQETKRINFLQCAAGKDAWNKINPARREYRQEIGCQIVGLSWPMRASSNPQENLIKGFP